MILICTLWASTVAFATNGASGKERESDPQESSSVAYNTPVPIVEDTAAEKTESEEAPNLADGEAGHGSIEAPDKYWTENGYPDDISFVQEAGGEALEDGTQVSWWRIGIVNADESRKQEILDMFSPKCIITFVDCQYSYSQRETVCDEIRASGYEAVQAVGLSPYSEQVLVQVSDEYAKEYAAQFVKQYGSFVVVTNDLKAAQNAGPGGGTGNGQGAEPGGGMGNSTDKDSVLWIWITSAILLIGASVLFFNRTRLIPAMQTTKGTIVTQSAPVSRKKTIEAIKNSEVTPSDEVFISVLGQIDKKGG